MDEIIRQIEIDGKIFDAEVEVWKDLVKKDFAKISTSAMTYEYALDLFQKELPWKYVYGLLEQDMSHANIFDHMEIYPSGELIIYMREQSDLEQAYELLYGGN